LTKILVIPDTQCKPGQDFEYLRCFGEYIVHKRPDIIVHLGDHWDMPSLSSYDIGKKSYEGRRYKADIQAGKDGMAALLKPMNDYNAKMRDQKMKQYKPEMNFHMGNHEGRVTRVINDTPMLDGTIGLEDMEVESFGWTVHPFLKVNVIHDIAFSHYFCTGAMGRPCGSAQAQLKNKYMSCIAGHQQGLQAAQGYRADGKRITSIICGSSYVADEDYLNAQTNKHWRGVLMLHNVCDGEFDRVEVPTSYLMERYAKAS